MTYASTFNIYLISPFSLGYSAQIFVNGDKSVRNFTDGVFQQVLKVNGDLILAQVSTNGDSVKPVLTVTLKSNKPITEEDKKAAESVIKYIFNLDFDLDSFYRAVENDPTMRKIAGQLYGYKFPTTSTAFEGLVDAIVEQQISIKVARTIEERIAKKFGDKLEVDGQCYFAFPTAQNFVVANLGDIQQTGLSQRKAEYIYNAAKLIVEGQLDLEAMKIELNPIRVVNELDTLKGIGVWTAELTMLRGMQRWDMLPADDFGIRRVISTYYCAGRQIKAIEAREIAEVWGKWKGLAAFYLIMAEVKGITV